jgi:hypothetical protein
MNYWKPNDNICGKFKKGERDIIKLINLYLVTIILISFSHFHNEASIKS